MFSPGEALVEIDTYMYGII